MPRNTSTLGETARYATFWVERDGKEPEPESDQNREERPETDSSFVACQFIAVWANDHFHAFLPRVELIVRRNVILRARSPLKPITADTLKIFRAVLIPDHSEGESITMAHTPRPMNNASVSNPRHPGPEDEEPVPDQEALGAL